MSKKSHKNRPKRHPAKMPRQHEVPEKESQGLLTRRNTLIALGTGGVAVLAWRLGLNKLFDDDQDGNKEIVTSQEKKEVGMKDPEWMKGIELPQTKLEPKPLNWGEKEKADYFLPKGLNPENLQRFYKEYDELKSAFLSKMSDIRDPKKRGNEISAFLPKLSVLYIKYTQKPFPPKLTYGTLEFAQAMMSINRILIPHDNLLLSGFDFEKGVSLAFFNTDEIHMAEIEQGDKKMSLPVIYLSGQQNVLTDTTKEPIGMNAFYSQDGNFLCIDIEGMKKQTIQVDNEVKERAGKLGLAVKPIDRSQFIEESFNVSLSHEGAHAALEGIMGIDSMGKNAIKPKGAIDMKGYQVPEDVYSGVDNLQIHELVAIGASLANAGDSVMYYAYSSDDRESKSYHLALVILLFEIIHSPFVARELRNQLMTDLFVKKMVVVDKRLQATAQIPPNELRKIGERMAKLGIYLTRK